MILPPSRWPLAVVVIGLALLLGLAPVSLLLVDRPGPPAGLSVEQRRRPRSRRPEESGPIVVERSEARAVGPP